MQMTSNAAMNAKVDPVEEDAIAKTLSRVRWVPDGLPMHGVADEPRSGHEQDEACIVNSARAAVAFSSREEGTQVVSATSRSLESGGT